MIGNTVQFYLDHSQQQGVILDKFCGKHDFSNGKYTTQTLVVDLYLIKMSNGDIVSIPPCDIFRVVSFYADSIFL